MQLNRCFGATAVLAAGLLAQTPQAAPLADGALRDFVGDWKISGVTRGKPTSTGAEVRAAFGGAFIELHIKDPAAASPYEARVSIGQDAAGGLVAHWLDATGGETSRTLGYGRAEGDKVTLRFAYPGGDFRDRLEYDRAHDRWRLLIETGPETQPKVFSDWSFDRIPSR